MSHNLTLRHCIGQFKSAQFQRVEKYSPCLDGGDLNKLWPFLFYHNISKGIFNIILEIKLNINKNVYKNFIFSKKDYNSNIII